MPDDCFKCLKKIDDLQKSLRCAVCRSKVHPGCLNMSMEVFSLYLQRKKIWRCQPCSRKITRRLTENQERKKVTAGGDVSSPTVRKPPSGGAEVKSTMKSNLREANSIIEAFARQNCALQMEIDTLKQRIEDIDQYNRRNALDISGIPFQQGEDLMVWVKRIAEAIGYELKEEMIDVLYRTSYKRNDDHNGDSDDIGILVFFVRRLDKEDMLRTFRLRPEGLKLTDLGIQKTGNVSIVGSLTAHKIRLLSEARRFARANNYKSVGTKNGEIYVRREEDSPQIFITNSTDITKLEKTIMENNTILDEMTKETCLESEDDEEE